MRILEFKAARGWPTAQTAKVFAITEDTIGSWMKRADDDGDRALVQTADPVNKYPDFVRYLVRRLKVLYPTMGMPVLNNEVHFDAASRRPAHRPAAPARSSPLASLLR